MNDEKQVPVVVAFALRPVKIVWISDQGEVLREEVLTFTDRFRRNEPLNISISQEQIDAFAVRQRTIRDQADQKQWEALTERASVPPLPCLE